MVKVKYKQTNKHVLHYKQLNTFDHPYHIDKYLDSEPSTFLPVNVPKPFQCCQMNIHLFLSLTYGFLLGAYICPRAAGPTSIMAKEVTRIVALFWPPGLY